MGKFRKAVEPFVRLAYLKDRIDHVGLLRGVGDGVGLELQAIACMGEFGLDGFAYGVFSVEPFPYDFFHDRNVPDIAEQTVHLYDMFKGEACQCQSGFHFVKGAVNLLFYGAAYVADTVA